MGDWGLIWRFPSGRGFSRAGALRGVGLYLAGSYQGTALAVP
jgi:hypothetical protein